MPSLYRCYDPAKRRYSLKKIISNVGKELALKIKECRTYGAPLTGAAPPRPTGHLIIATAAAVLQGGFQKYRRDSGAYIELRARCNYHIRAERPAAPRAQRLPLGTPH